MSTWAKSNLGGRLLTGIASLVLLAALLVGVPAMLWLMHGNPLPTSISVDQLKDSLLTPDTDASLFVSAAVLAGWLAWLWFTCGVVLEVVSLVRGVSLPSVGGLRVSRRWAAGLIGGTLLLAPVTATAEPVTEPPRPVPSSAPAAPAVTSTASEHLTTIQYTVQEGNTLWDLAEVFLGDGHRWPEIQRVNPGLNPDRLAPGQAIAMPTNLLGSGNTYTVTDGDSLWTIAAVFLGDGDRWTELSTTTGEPLASHLIHPGQIIQIPGAALETPTSAIPESSATPPMPDTEPAPVVTPDTAPVPEPAAPSVPSPATDVTPETGDQALPPLPPGFEAEPRPADQSPERAPAPTTEPGEQADAPESAAPEPDPAPAAGASSTAPATDLEADGAPESATDQGMNQIQTIGIIGLVAAGAVAAVSLARRRQQHRRRRGDRIAMPTGAAAEIETSTRATASDDETLKKLDAAVQSIAGFCHRTERPLPTLLGVSILEDSLAMTMLDADDLELPSPWQDQGGGVWSLPWSARLDTFDAPAGVNPYPALVQLGTTDGDAPMLINLEEVADLSVISDSPEDAVEAARSLAVALALSPMATDLGLTLVGVGKEIADLLGMDRMITWSADADPVLDQLARQTGHAAAALAAADLDSIAAARSAGAPATLEVVVFGAPLTGEQRDRLTQILSNRPKVAVAAVCATIEPGSSGWTLSLNGTTEAMLTSGDDGVGMAITPALVGGKEYAELIEILETSQRPPRRDPDSPEPSEWAAAAVDNHIHATDHPDDLVPPMMSFSVVDGQPDDPTVAPALDNSQFPDAQEQERDSDLPQTAASEGSEDSGRGEAAVEIPHIWIHLLGEPRVTPLNGVTPEDLPALKGRTAVCTELASILALRPGILSAELDSLLWPRSGNLTATSLARRRQDPLRRLRKWLGETADGHEALPRTFDRSGNSGYRLDSSVVTDWQVWQQLLAAGPVAASTEQLEAAASLVTGRPFDGVPAARYAWAEAEQQDMISAISDALEELAARYIQAGDLVRAGEIAAKAVTVDPSREGPWRLQILATASRDIERTRQTIADMITYFDELGVGELESETDELFLTLSRFITENGEQPYLLGLPTIRKPGKRAS